MTPATPGERALPESGGLGLLFTGQLRRDLLLALGQPSELLNPLAFFAVVIALFPMGISPEPEQLARLAPGALWIAALLSTLLGLEALFRRDLDDGTLEHLVLAARPLYVAVLARVTAHWLVTGLPLTLLAPVLGVMLNLPEVARGPVWLGLLLGTPILTLLGAVGAALTVGLRSGGVLLALLVVPLYVPVLIVGVSAATLAVDGFDTRGLLAWLGAGLALGVTALPLAIAGALRLGVEAG